MRLEQCRRDKQDGEKASTHRSKRDEHNPNNKSSIQFKHTLAARTAQASAPKTATDKATATPAMGIHVSHIFKSLAARFWEDGSDEPSVALEPERTDSLMGEIE